MKSRHAIEEYKRFVRGLNGLDSAMHRSLVLKKEFEEAKEKATDGKTPPTFHKISGPVQDMHFHIEKIFEKHIGRLVVKEASEEVFERKRRR